MIDSSNKKIVHILPAFFYEKEYSFEKISSSGGGERFASQLSLQISKILDTTLITFGEKDYEFKYNTLNIKIIKCNPFLKSINGKVDFLSLSLIKEIKNYDIIHAHQYYADSTLLAVIAGKYFGKQVFVTDHGWRGFNFARFFPTKIFAKKLLIQTLYDKRRFNLNKNKYDLIYGGVDLIKFKYSNNKIRKVVFLGRILPHKGIDVLIKSLDDKTECLVLGHKLDDEYFKDLKRIANRKQVQFIIDPSDAEIINELQSSSVLVLPSVDQDMYGKKVNNPELFGLVVAEAFSTGTPVIVSNCGALPYVVDNGINGFVVKQNSVEQLRDKINFILSNKRITINMGKNGRKKVEKLYNWENVAQICIKNYLNK